MANRNGLDLELELENLVCDLVSAQQYQAFLKRLFATGRGDWKPLDKLCGNWPEVGNLLDRLDGAVYAAWLDYPDGSKDYSLVVFFREADYWSKAAVVNRSLVVAKRKSIAKVKR